MLAELDTDQSWPLQVKMNVSSWLEEQIDAVRTQHESQNAAAVESFAELLAEDYEAPEEWLRLAQVGIMIQQPELARAACDAADRLGLASTEHWCVQAGLLHLLDEPGKAENAYVKATEIQPESALSFYRFGTFLLEKGRPQEAIDLYHRLLGGSLQDIHSELLAEIYASCAVAKLGLGRNEEAIEMLLALLSVDPAHHDFNYLMGLALKKLKEFEQAADFFRMALPQRDHGVDTYILLADCLRQMDRPDLAIHEYETALGIHSENPEHEVLSLNLAQMYFRIGANEKALAIYDSIIEYDPRHVLAKYLLLASLSACGRPEVCRMRDVAESLWRVFREGNGLSDANGFVPKDASAVGGDPGPIKPSAQIKVGILSSEIGDHVVGMFLTPLLENFSRDHFQIDLISCRDWKDARSDYLCSLASSIVRLGGLNEVEAREVIRAQKYDIVIETSGYTHSPSLFILAERCAPIQCHYIGFHATTGLDTIDYFIGDEEILGPEVADQFSETLWPLPRPWLARSRSDGLPLAVSRATYDGPVFGCFSSLQKVTDTTLRFWGEALRAVPESVLLIKDRLTAVPVLREKILDALNSFGVDPSRVSFLGKTISWQEHMDTFNLIDIAFDTTPWSGATTAFDTLSMGVPLIGIRGNAAAGRMSSSVLRAIGAEGWISSTPEEFARIARVLADDVQRLRKEREELQNHVLASPLFDAAGLVQSLEAAFECMVKTSRQGVNPQPDDPL